MNHLVVWQRILPTTLEVNVQAFLQHNPTFQMSITVTPKNVLTNLRDILSGQPVLCEDIVRLVEMFCYLFELEQVGLRLATLSHAMCPIFHVDRVPCRLVTTYHGKATEWLPHETVNREKLGMVGKCEGTSGLYQRQGDIQQLQCGDVALLKGELWQGNANAGLVHRSPALSAHEQRLLLTLNFIS